MAASFKYGLTSSSLSSLALLELPDGLVGFGKDRVINRRSYESVDGAIFQRFVSRERQTFTAKFRHKTLADYVKILRMCDVAQKYYIEISDSDNVWFEGFVYIYLVSEKIKTQQDPYYIDFDVKIEQTYGQ